MVEYCTVVNTLYTWDYLSLQVNNITSFLVMESNQSYFQRTYINVV